MKNLKKVLLFSIAILFSLGIAFSATLASSSSTTTPLISSVSVTPRSDGATITWTTNVLTNSLVYYTDLIDGETSSKTDTNLVTNHVISISGLSASHDYKYYVVSNGAAPSTEQVFTTLASMVESVAVPAITTTVVNFTDQANSLGDSKISKLLAQIDSLKNTIAEQANQIKYLNNLVKGTNISADAQNTLNNFVTYGSDSNTKKLGAGERAAVIASYKSAFDKLPITQAELTDVVKIANGRWPSTTSVEAESQAKVQFKKIYQREANMNNANDNAAVTIMAYGLRQKAENRNLNSEAKGISTFKAIYGHTPNTTEEWNIMQAVTYSGSSR